MPFYDRLIAETETRRAAFLSTPILQRAMHGDVGKEDYLAFLGQAYHHVKHTVPLLMGCGYRLPERLDWLREAIGEYIEEEMGHEKWILDDIRACGGDAESVHAGTPLPATELMVAYAYDLIERRNAVGFFGMVLVLEGTSVDLATRAAAVIQQKLDLPGNAFRYLTSHGALDQEHIKLFAGLMNRIDDPADQDSVIHSARMFYRLYGDIFRSITPTA